MNLNNVIVFDLETGSKDPATTQMLEIAAIAIDPIKWVPIHGSEFVSLVKPDDESKLEPQAMAVNKIKIEDLRRAPSSKIVMDSFKEHIRRYGGKTSSPFTAPYPAGKNIRDFDLPIINRYCIKHKIYDSNKVPNLFNRKWSIELEDDLFRWFGQTNITDNLSMDTVRTYFGIDKEGAHRAIIDVRQTAWLICKFQKFYREQSKKIGFETSGVNVDFSEPLTELDFV